jgi:hypothetical protein
MSIAGHFLERVFRRRPAKRSTEGIDRVAAL